MDNGYLLASLRKISGCSTIFQLSMKDRIARDAIPPLDIGSMILKKICTNEQPSTFAASIHSLGINIMNCLSRNTPKALNTPGKTRDR